MSKLLSALFVGKKHDKEQSVELPSAMIFGQFANKTVEMENSYEEIFVSWETPLHLKDNPQQHKHLSYSLVRQANDPNVTFHPSYDMHHFAIVQFVNTTSSSNRLTGQLIYQEKRNDELTMPNCPCIASVQEPHNHEIHFVAMIPKEIVVWTLNTITLRVTKSSISHLHKDLRKVYTVLDSSRIIFTTSHCLVEFDVKSHKLIEHHYHLLFKKIIKKEQVANPIALVALSSRYLFFWVKLTEFGGDTITTLINTMDPWQALPFRCSIMGDRDWSEENYQSLKLSSDTFLLANDMDTLLFSSTQRIISFLQGGNSSSSSNNSNSNAVAMISDYTCSLVEQSSFNGYTLLFAPHYGDLMRVKISSLSHSYLSREMNKLLDQTITFSNGDTTILTATKILSCHSVIVMSRAPKLAQAIDKQSKLLTLNSYSAESVIGVLQFIYTASISSLNLATDISLIKEMKQLAEQFELASVIKLCDKYLRKQDAEFISDDSIKLQLLLNQGNAKQLAEQMVKDFPEDPKGYAYCATLALQSGNPWQSLKLYSKAHLLDSINLGYENAITCIFQQLVSGYGAVLSPDQQEVINSIQRSSLAKSFAELIQIGSYDMRFIVHEKNYGAHQVFVKLGSDIVPTMLLTLGKDLCPEFKVHEELPDVNDTVMEVFLQYIYTRETRKLIQPLSTLNVMILCKLANFFGYADLEQECGHLLCTIVSVANAVNLLDFAHLMQHQELYLTCAQVLHQQQLNHVNGDNSVMMNSAAVFDMKKLKYTNNKIVDLLVLTRSASWLPDHTISLIPDEFNQMGRIWFCQGFNFAQCFSIRLEMQVSKVNPKFPLISNNSTYLDFVIQNPNQTETPILFEFSPVDRSIASNSCKDKLFQPMFGDERQSFHVCEKVLVHIIGKFDEETGECIYAITIGADNIKCDHYIVTRLGKKRTARFQELAKKEPYYFAVEAITRRTYCQVVVKGFEVKMFASAKDPAFANEKLQELVKKSVHNNSSVLAEDE